LNTTFANN